MNENTGFVWLLKRLGLRILITVILISLIIIPWDFFTFMFSPHITYTFSAKNCERLFGVTPQEFETTYLDLYRETGDLREKAYVKGNTLQLTLTRREERALRKSKWLSGFKEYKDGKMFSISRDFKEITAYIPKDQTYEMEKDMESRLDAILNKIEFIQVMDNIPVGECAIKYTEVDATTGEILHTEYINPRY